MNTTKQKVENRCLQHAKNQIERLKNGDPINPLDITYEVMPNGDITEVRLVTTTGGPHVEIELNNEVVEVSWASDSVRRIIMDDEAKQRCKDLAEKHTELANF